MGECPVYMSTKMFNCLAYILYNYPFMKVVFMDLKQFNWTFLVYYKVIMLCYNKLKLKKNM